MSPGDRGGRSFHRQGARHGGGFVAVLHLASAVADCILLLMHLMVAVKLGALLAGAAMLPEANGTRGDVDFHLTPPSFISI